MQKYRHNSLLLCYEDDGMELRLSRFSHEGMVGTRKNENSVVWLLEDVFPASQLPSCKCVCNAEAEHAKVQVGAAGASVWSIVGGSIRS